MPARAGTASQTMFKRPHSQFLIVLLAAVTVSASLAIDLCLPAFPAMAESLATDMGKVQQTLSVFIIGVGFGQLIYGPLSDRYGRKSMLVFGMAFYCLTSFLCAFAPTVEHLIVFRLLQSFGAAVGAVVARAVVRDLYYGEQAAKIFSQIFLVMLVAPLLAPLISAQLLNWFSWRFIFLLLGVFGCLLLFAVIFLLPETLPQSKRRKSLFKNLPREYLNVLTDRRTLGYLLCGSFTFAGMFAFVTAAPFVYIQYYGIPVEYFGLWYGSNILLVSLLSWVNSRFIERVGLGPMLNYATWLSMIAGVAVLVFALTGIGGLLGFLCFR
jgi:DHA1 family bicyclomycin/chloramphenicol resistance-like MFS transporter